MGNILEKADNIINKRKEEKERQYGDINVNMKRAAKILIHLIGQTYGKIDASLMFKAMIAIKLSRETHKHKEDNLVDLVAYVSALNDYLENEDNK
jgi:hypothetical protein